MGEMTHQEEVEFGRVNLEELRDESEGVLEQIENRVMGDRGSWSENKAKAIVSKYLDELKEPADLLKLCVDKSREKF
jgi:hypothetical protein